MSDSIVPITKLNIENVRCIENIELDFGILTVLVGKNDTGKSTILECVRDCSRVFSQGRNDVNFEKIKPNWLSHYGNQSRVSIAFEDSRRFQFNAQESKPDGRTNVAVKEVLHSAPGESLSPMGELKEFSILERFARWRSPYQLSASQLREPVEVGALRGSSLAYDGFGLSDILDRMPLRRFAELNEQFTRRIPHVEEVLREAYYDYRGEFVPGKKAVYFQLKSGAKVPCSQVSDGAMLVLGYLALFMDVNPQPLILIEEPENGIHPGQLKDLMSLIKDMTLEQRRVQVIMTTHSPYLLDYVPRESIRVITRTDSEGTKAQRFEDVPEISKMLGAGYSTGEAWANHDQPKIEVLRG